MSTIITGMITKKIFSNETAVNTFKNLLRFEKLSLKYSSPKNLE